MPTNNINIRPGNFIVQCQLLNNSIENVWHLYSHNVEHELICLSQSKHLHFFIDKKNINELRQTISNAIIVHKEYLIILN